MPRRRIALLNAAILVALGLAGCSHPAPAPEPPATPSSTSPTGAPPAAALPAPQALTDVLYRIADPAVPGTDKLSLVADATPADAGTLDKFATALHDNGYTPPTFEAGDIAWSDARPANVVATITVRKPDGAEGGGSFPMEFTAHAGGWQLSRETLTTLLDLGA